VIRLFHEPRLPRETFWGVPFQDRRQSLETRVHVARLFRHREETSPISWPTNFWVGLDVHQDSVTAARPTAAMRSRSLVTSVITASS